MQWLEFRNGRKSKVKSATKLKACVMMGAMDARASFCVKLNFFLALTQAARLYSVAGA